MQSEADARKKRFETYRYHILRILLFAGACICAVTGMLMLTLTTDSQTRAQTVTGEIVTTEPQAEVLLLCSYSEDDGIATLERNGVVDILRRSSLGVDVEYMDARKYASDSAAGLKWKETFNAKLQAHGSYSTVICADDEALAYVQENHESLFANTPVVFFGVNDSARANSAVSAGYATGVYENMNITDTMALTCTLLPKATKFLVIVDNTMTGTGDLAQFKEAATGFAKMDVEYVNASTITRDELGERVASAGNDTILFFLDAYEDSQGNTYTLDQSAFYIARMAKQPVFRGMSGGVGEGICGAGFTDPEKSGQQAADMTVKVLNGTKPASIPLITDGPSSFVFDSKVISKYDITSDALPGNAVLINQSAFSWSTISPILLPIGLMIAGIVLVLIFAFMGYRRSIQDTREIIESRNDIQYRYYHDSLTDLPNMAALQEIGRLPENDKRVLGVIKVDLDDLNDVNDSYGHSVGDAVIKEASERLKGLSAEYLVRPSGDEFLLGFSHEIEQDGMEIKLIRAIFEKPFAIDEFELEVTASLGVVNRTAAMSVEETISAVDLATREGKKGGLKGSLFFYNTTLKKEMEDKLAITSYLKQSILDENFVVLYQPQVDTVSNDVGGYEALVRLEGDAYYPGQFIPVAEQSGMVIEVDRIVTKKVVQQLATWKKRHKRLRPVSINYSAVQLKDEGYVDFLIDLLKRYDVAPNLIKIEITESLLLGSEEQTDQLFSRLKSAGIAMALDDFGTGYTSLSRVTTIPADVVKIDKSLVDAYMVPGKERFLDDLTRLVHGLKKKIIVEGVETKEQLEICRELGCDMVQGYYFSKPLLPERAAQFEPKKD